MSGARGRVLLTALAGAGLAGAGLVAAALLPSPNTAAAQTAARLDLQAQTLFVEADDPAEIALRVSGAPDTAVLLFTIYDTPVLTREAVRDHHENPPSEGPRKANFECTLDGDCREQATMTSGPDGTVTVTLNDDLLGESLRNEDGVFPFVVRLVDDGETLDEIATSLIVLPDDSPATDGQNRARIAFTSEVLLPVALQPDGALAIDGNDVRAAAAELTAYPDIAVTTEIRPETLDALRASDRGALDDLLTALAGRALLRSPWVDMDEEAWRLVGESDRVVAHYARGSETFEAVVGQPPTGIVRLDPDATPETLALLRTAGATAVLVDDDQLSDATLAVPPTQPFQLLDANGVAMTALRTDEALHHTLAHDDPELAAYRAIAELTALAEEATTDLAVLLHLDDLNPAALDLLLDGIGDRRSLRVASVADLTERDLARVDGESLRGELTPTAAPTVGDLAADLNASATGLATLARMLEPEIDLVEPSVDLLQAAVSADLDLAQARAYVRAVDAEIDLRRTGIEIPAADRITLTDRRTDLPLTIVNRQPLPINVEVLLTAEKIRFPGGDRLTLTLNPGANPLTIPVETLASGDARVTATVVSPGGFFELTSGTVDIRSTAISGLGLVISIVALVVLAVWWIRTILRVRRNRGAATVSAASAPEESTPIDAPTEGES